MENKKKWDYEKDKILDAIDYCEVLENKGFAYHSKIICGLFGESHTNRNFFQITEKGMLFIKK